MCFQYLLKCVVLLSIYTRAADSSSYCTRPSKCVLPAKCEQQKGTVVFYDFDNEKAQDKCQYNRRQRKFTVCCQFRRKADPPEQKLQRELMQTCGLQKDDYIIRGSVSKLEAHPWLVLLQEKNQNDYHCGGAIIAPRFVLTAAHCMSLGDPTRYIVILGEYNTKEVKDCVGKTCIPPVERKHLEQIIDHYKFNKRTRFNDISLLKLKDTIQFNVHIKMICLPWKGILPLNLVGKRAVVAGWGKTEKGVSNDRKREVSVPIQTMEFCYQRHLQSKSFDVKPLTDDQMCAEGEDNRGSCAGDSGGSLMYYNMNQELEGKSQWFTVGVVSYGLGTGDFCLTKYPAIYSNVTHFMPWIIKHLLTA